MASFFNVGNLGNLGINPFSTVVGQKIEEATDGSQASENWAVFLEICDIINDTDDGGKDAIRAIKKRLQQYAGKNYKIIMFTLTLLESCVKNCEKFRVHACSKDFTQELMKLIGPKNDPPIFVQEKVLCLIQSWADAFFNVPECAPIVHLYKDLRSKGVEFPMTDLDTMSPIHTPRKVVVESDHPKQMPSPQKYAVDNVDTGFTMSAEAAPFSNQYGHHSAAPDVTAVVSQNQLAKLRSELDIVQGNMSVLNEMLNELVPGEEREDDLSLLTDLYGTCKIMQERIMELINELTGDEITADLLRINDLLNNLFLRYSRYEKNREAKLSQLKSPKKTPDEIPSLIDLDVDDESVPNMLATKMSNLGINTSLASPNPFPPVTSSSSNLSKIEASLTKDEPEFDMFAQSRNVTYESSKKTGSTYEDNIKPDLLSGGLARATQARSQAQHNNSPIHGTSLEQQPPSMMHNESDFDEMAAWLGEAIPTTSVGIGEHDSLTSSEFERFLAERAAAAESLPQSPTNSSNTRASSENPKPVTQ